MGLSKQSTAVLRALSKTIPEDPILPEQIWHSLTTVQQQMLFRTMVQMCRTLMQLDKGKPATVDGRMSYELR